MGGADKALLEATVFYDQAARLTELYPSLAFVSSVGVAALTGQELAPRVDSGARRDMDVLSTSSQIDTRALRRSNLGPHNVDTVFHEWVRWQNGTPWLVCPYASDNAATEVRADVFALRCGTLAGRRVNTFDPRTLLGMYHIMGPRRPKDERPIEVLSSLVESGRSCLSEELVRPFIEFGVTVGAIRKRRSTLQRAAETMVAGIPNPIKECSWRLMQHPTVRRAVHYFISS